MLRAITVGALLLTLVLGCAQDPLSTGSDSPPSGWAQAAGPIRTDQVHTLPDGLGGPIVNMDFDDFDEVMAKAVKAGKVEVVGGSRYSLEFKEGSLERSAIITISERHPYIVDVVLGPHGSQFGEPVTLVINYAGTANDPDMPYFHGEAPAFYWIDEEKDAWVPHPGWDNPSEKTYTVLLSHFSRYAMTDGTGGWEGPATSRVRSGKEFVTTK